MNANYVAGSDLYDGWQAAIATGTLPTLYPVATGDSGLSRIEIGPELVTLFGGPPGAGKTAFVMQLVFDALRLTPHLRALVCNVEMPATASLERQLARMSGIDLTTIRHRKFTEDIAARLASGLEAVETVAQRIGFVRTPFTTENIAHSADKHKADVIVLDYVQRIVPGGDHATRKSSVDEVMNLARKFADSGVAVVLVAAVGRSKDSKGRNAYGDLNLASFRESSELEYGADDAFLLVRKLGTESCDLKHVKSRNGEPKDIPLKFDGPTQRFDSSTPLAALFDQTEAAKSKGDDW